MIKAVFFDFDLTLVNSRPGALASYKALCKTAKIKPTKKGFQEYVGKRFSIMVDEFSKISGVSKKELIRIYLKVYSSKIPKMKVYSKNLFKKLKHIKKAVITNNNRKATQTACRYFNLKYDILIADDDMKKREKKHDAIKRMLKKLHLKHEETLYVGDHVNDVIEAHKAGIKSVIVPTGVFSKAYLKKYHPDFMIHNINEVLKLV